MPTLPDHEAVFAQFVLPHLAPDALRDRRFPGTFPDMMHYEAGASASEILPASDEAFQAFHQRVKSLVSWQADSLQAAGVVAPGVDASPEEFLDWVDLIDGYWTPERVSLVLAASSQRGDRLFGQVLGFGAVLGTALTLITECRWLPASPIIDSAVRHPRSGHEVFVFHWAIKKFSSYGIDDGFVAKLLRVREILELA